MSFALFLLYYVVLSLWWWVGGGGVPSDYLVSTQLQLWLFCFLGCGCCWAVLIYIILIVDTSRGKIFSGDEVGGLSSPFANEI